MALWGLAALAAFSPSRRGLAGTLGYGGPGTFAAPITAARGP